MEKVDTLDYRVYLRKKSTKFEAMLSNYRDCNFNIPEEEKLINEY